MIQAPKSIALLTLIQFCGNSTPSPEEQLAEGQVFSCSEYQLMLEVEMMVAGECVEDSECDQIVITGDLDCEANSLVATTNFDTIYFYDMYDEALGYGCSIELDMNDDCSLTTTGCNAGVCGWR